MAAALLPYGAAYSGATQPALDAIKNSTPPTDYFPTVFNPATATSKGHKVLAHTRVPPSKDGTKGFRCYYEVHGSGPVRIVFVMGLNNSSFGWLPQVEKFASDERYSCLVMDNRGVGNSDTPGGLYKTSEMAQDVHDLLTQLSWTSSDTPIHLVGVSMGGMISLEFAKRYPDLVSSLTLISTSPGGRRYSTPSMGLRSLVRVLGGRVVGMDSDAYRLNRLIETLFPVQWLDKESEHVGGKTNRQVLFKMFAWRFQFTRRQSVYGAVAQIKAALTHNVSDAELREIDAKVGKVAILTGDIDHLVDPRNSEYLADKMPSAEMVRFEVAGHALGNQFADRVNEVIERVVREGEERRSAKGQGEGAERRSKI